jgi:hypothetical protein
MPPPRNVFVCQDGTARTRARLDITPWTVEMALEQGQNAFDRMSSAPGDTLKMLLRVS